MDAKRYAKTAALLIGLAAASMLAAGCGVQNKQESKENYTAAKSEVSGPIGVDDEEIEIPSVTLPEKDISLSPMSNGTLLQIGEKKQQFEWIYTTPRVVLPRLQVTDYDEDGSDELAVVLHIGSGTGVSIDELHLVEYEGKKERSGSDSEGTFQDHIFADEDYLTQIKRNLQFTTSEEGGELFGHVTVDGMTTTISLKQFQTGFDGGKVSDTLGYGAIVQFNVEDEKLKASFAVGINIDKVAEPQYIGEIHAEVGYKDGEFLLSKFQFAPDIS